MPDISIIVPVFNEAENILPLCRQMQAVMHTLEKEGRLSSRPAPADRPAAGAGSWELVFVDDCSTDSTWKQILHAHDLDRRVRGVRHLRNAGQSAALWTGIRATESPIIVTLDGDLQNDPADIPTMLARLDQCEFVCGRRANRRDGLIRRISSRIARAARNAVLKADFADTGCAMRVFKRSALDGILPFNGWHRFLPVLVHHSGARAIEVPVNHRPRVAGVSKYGLGNRLWRGIYDLIGVRWYQKRRLTSVPTDTIEGASAAEVAEHS